MSRGKVVGLALGVVLLLTATNLSGVLSPLVGAGGVLVILGIIAHTAEGPAYTDWLADYAETVLHVPPSVTRSLSLRDQWKLEDELNRVANERVQNALLAHQETELRQLLDRTLS